MTQQPQHLIPAHLWVGNHQDLLVQVYQWLQKFFTACNACQVCASCRAIAQRQHHAVTWLTPHGSAYILNDIESLLYTISFALEPDQHHVFVIEHADALTAACSNRLLKTVEEPPQGYHFVFLTERLDEILPTLRSRCIVQQWHGQSSTHTDTLSSFFMSSHRQSPHVFFQELEKRKPSEQTTMSLLDEILMHWLTQVRCAYITDDAKQKKEATRMVTAVRSCFARPLMPGSSKLLLRDLFLQMYCV